MLKSGINILLRLAGKLQVFRLLQPDGGCGITRHAPVATRTEAHASHLRTIRQTAALELLVEETANKCLEPFLDSLLIVGIRIVVADFHTLQLGIDKRLLSQHVNLDWTETEAQEVIEEEIVQLVWSHQVFRLLLDVSVLIGRNQFRTDRRINDVAQGDAALLLSLIHISEPTRPMRLSRMPSSA